MRLRSLFVIGLLVLATTVTTAGASAGAASSSPSFGPNVHIFSPSMGQATIQSQLNEIAVAQVHNQFGTRRDAVLFEPGTYGSVAHPLVFQVGYYTSVAGLGLSPNDVHIVGAIEVPNQCNNNDINQCFALVNFWRSVSNLTIDVHTAGAQLLPAAATAPEAPGCVGSNELFAVSQASPLRRVNVNGLVFLFDYCGQPQFASGGFIADSKTGFVINASQQQWITRNSSIGGWSNGVWNQVFSGVQGAPAQCFPCVNPYTTLPTSPVTREAPYLYQDANGAYNVFVPSVQHDTSGTSWSAGQTPGRSIPIQDFFIATPSDPAPRITSELASGKNLILTPGVYHLDQAIQVTHPDTVVLGLGFPTLVPDHGKAAIRALNARGVILSGLLFDAGAESSDVLLQVGNGNDTGDAADPSLLADVFFRIGGPAVGKASTALVVNSGNVILDDIWVWRADHGTGVGWTSNTADTGVVVNGDNVTA
ncbi:MAG TPA: adenylyl cyclase, partial [Candidatus Dormibacteraeota bacterium]|nr:adenylyl cyclase [Candidatus Dormibacteraeota bacterium]